MSILRTRTPQAVPATAATLEPFRLMRDFLRWDPLLDYGPGAPTAFMPSFDVKETPDAYQFRADLPGILEAELEISLEGSRLTVAGKRDEESMKEGERIHLSERSHGSFSRTFTLPEDVEGEKVVAELRNGVLTLMVPKRPEVRPRKINVSLG
ncbi:MAG: Hsp20 family protein [Holophagaceae bacterium]|jgi:HSP20 family protein|uniref:Hsp20 family protein n=1 Tax=Candidatus Geothrix odensensis TaxID=2954440 RepID=A0A936K6Q0_9BACT|nr:Hsp20 family protein [Holophagaceae bacterium]MBK8572390.1 Hsp20 family protein [Candidatus Geothrix odensensis]MBK8789084.1 Hsp20 family protein [Holophagaceae bacterium]